MQVLEIRERLLRKSVVPGTAWSTFIWRMLAVLVIMPMLAHWSWVLFAPQSDSVLPAVLPTSDFQTEQLFGNAAASAITVQAVMPNVRLVGVFAGVPGFAVLELDGKRQLGLATGREIVAGVKLIEVAIDHVVIEHDGVRQQIPLAEKTSDSLTVVPVPPLH